jgi:Tfp pilus assembly protein PilO
MMLLLVAGFFILNFLGYQTLAQRRSVAIGQQRSLRFDIARLKELQAAKPMVDVTSEWVAKKLPAYTDIDQLETHLFNVVSNKAIAADVELTKKDPRPTQKDAMVHRSILEIETTAAMENLIKFLHSLQGREDFIYISFLELTPTKDEERVRCQARIEQWWSPLSDQLDGVVSSDVPRLPSVPLLTPPPAPAGDPAAPTGEGQPAAQPAPAQPPATVEQPTVEQPAATEVQPPSPPPAPSTPPQ